MIKSDDKKRARINAMRYILQQMPYSNKDERVACAPDALIVGIASELYEEGERTLLRPSRSI